MNTYALIAKYRGQPALYTRTVDAEGNLSGSARAAEYLSSYAVARKLAEKEGFTVVKNWADAEAHAAMMVKAEVMKPEQPLVWTNYAAAAHRAKTPDGTYYIKRWHLNDDGEWVIGRASHKVEQDWVIDFVSEPANGNAIDIQIERVAWWKPVEEMRHTLEHAKTSCQHHANARLLSV